MIVLSITYIKEVRRIVITAEGLVLVLHLKAFGVCFWYVV